MFLDRTLFQFSKQKPVLSLFVNKRLCQGQASFDGIHWNPFPARPTPLFYMCNVDVAPASGSLATPCLVTRKLSCHFNSGMCQGAQKVTSKGKVWMQLLFVCAICSQGRFTGSSCWLACCASAANVLVSLACEKTNFLRAREHILTRAAACPRVSVGRAHVFWRTPFRPGGFFVLEPQEWSSYKKSLGMW